MNIQYIETKIANRLEKYYFALNTPEIRDSIQREIRTLLNEEILNGTIEPFQDIRMEQNECGEMNVTIIPLY